MKKTNALFYLWLIVSVINLGFLIYYLVEQNERICHLESKGFNTSDAKIIVKIESDMTVELEELERFSKLLD